MSNWLLTTIREAVGDYFHLFRRSMTIEEALNKHHLCPDCGGKRFIIGPSAGLAVNIKCARCGSTFWFAPPFTPERIDPVEGVYTRPPVDLREWLKC